MGDIVGTALQRASKILSRHRVEVEISPDLPMVMVDAVLFEQVLFNLLDNAAKYAPPDTTVRIVSRRENEGINLHVLDEGPRHSPGRPGTHLRQVLQSEQR